MKPKNRVYCYDCGRAKMLFETEAKALTFIKFNGDPRLYRTRHAPNRAYYCECCCGWHVTSKAIGDCDTSAIERNERFLDDGGHSEWVDGMAARWRRVVENGETRPKLSACDESWAFIKDVREYKAGCEQAWKVEDTERLEADAGRFLMESVGATAKELEGTPASDQRWHHLYGMYKHAVEFAQANLGWMEYIEAASAAMKKAMGVSVLSDKAFSPAQEATVLYKNVNRIIASMRSSLGSGHYVRVYDLVSEATRALEKLAGNKYVERKTVVEYIDAVMSIRAEADAMAGIKRTA